MIKNKKLNKLIPVFFLALIISFAVFLRTYKLHEALGDWHSWRQADTASVAREYVKAGRIDLLTPRFHDLSSIPSGLDNPEGYRMVEFPLRDALHAELDMLFPSVGFVEWGRIISIGSSAVTIPLIYLIVSSLSGSLAALSASAVYAVLPYSVYYGRVILPEPMLVMFTLAALYSYIRSIDTGKLFWWFAFWLSLACAVLLKPTALIVTIPIAGYFISSNHKSWRSFVSTGALTILAVLPYYLWRSHISAYPSGIPASDWLFNSNHIRFKGAWFRWLFGERIGKLILGYWGLIPLGLGLAKLGNRAKETLVYGGMIAGSLIYLSVIATGNVQHDYYQIQILPTIAIVTGVGIAYLISLKKTLLSKLIFGLGIAAVCVLGCALSWYEIQGYFWVNNRAMVAAGQYIDTHTPSDSLIIAPYQGDTAFLFQTNRRGWPIGGDIEQKIKAGADYYVTTTRDEEYQSLKKKYTSVYESDQFSVIKL